MKKWIAILLVLGLAMALGAILHQSSLMRVGTWQKGAGPGRLSSAHASLESRCAACHTSVKGVEAANCVVCHANNEALLQRQTTAFHAHIQSCRECHLEHQGANRRPTTMDHVALAQIGLREMSEDRAESEKQQIRGQLMAWIRQHGQTQRTSSTHPNVSPQEMVLDCASCHANKDKHTGLFGQDCAQCHATTKWTLAEFRHPSPRSPDCAQCHQAPPSHYMEHFKMISARIAKQPNANLSQCFLCHQTTSWNDIKGVGWYKHH
ncbi:MAG: hypothetical protein AB1898_11095 [Acidobacteriota bacterium]